MREFRLEIFYRKRTIITKIFLKIHLDITTRTEERLYNIDELVQAYNPKKIVSDECRMQWRLECHIF